MTNTKIKFYLLITILVLSLLGGGLYADKLIRDAHIASSHEETTHSLYEIHNKLLLNLYNNIQVVKGLPSIFAINPTLSQQQFSSAAKQVLVNNTQLRNIAAAPDLVIRYMYPIKGNELAVGLDYRTKPEQLKSVLRAKNSQTLSLAGPIKLVQGGAGLISRIPVFIDDSSGNEYFWGIISAVIDADLFFEQSGLLNPNLPIEISIRGKDGLGTDGDVFFGDPSLFQSRHIKSTIALPNGSWVIAARPVGDWTAAPDDIWLTRSYLLLSATVLFILLFTFIKTLMNSALTNLKFKQYLEDTPIPYVLNNKHRQVVFINSAFTRLFGYTLADLRTDEDWWLNAYPDETYRDQIKVQWNKYFNEFKSSKDSLMPLEVNFHCKNGEIKTVLVSLSASTTTDDPITFYDITERKQSELAAIKEIENLAFYDPLTQLPNRRLLIDRLNHSITSNVRSDNYCAILFIDLDYFKTLNDTLGHVIGDVLLQQVAARISSNLRREDTIARFGGDEFVVLLENLGNDREQAACYAEKTAHKLVTALNQTYRLRNHEYNSSASIGTTLFHKQKTTVDELLKQADIAMYQAKDSGRNAFRIFSEDMQTTITSRVALEKELEQAIDFQQFSLFYQIQIDENESVIGAEALIRWIHPKRGVLSPFHFISIAEETELIIPIGKWVLATACKQIQEWEKSEQTKNLVLSVNVCAQQFHQKEFLPELEMLINSYNIRPEKLKLELTESLLLNNNDEIINKMNHIAKLGIQFSLDDFGTGYSSLQYLKRLPLNQLKIDQSFVRDLVTDVSDQVIVQTIIAMAHSLGFGVIAEGVETIEQKQALLQEGCKHFQGYLFSKPIPIEEFETLLNKSSAT